jgi:hypothetical protein
MPHYVFRITNGDQVLEPDAGSEPIDLPGDAAARDEAAKFARALFEQGTAPDGDWSGWFVAVTRDGNIAVDSIPILPPVTE